MLYVLVAHQPVRYNRRHDKYTDGVFVCEEFDAPEKVEACILKLLATHDFDVDDLYVYEIAGRDGDAYYDAEGNPPNDAQRFLYPAKAKARAVKQAAEAAAIQKQRDDTEAKRVAAEKAERTYYEKLKAKFEGA